MNRITTWVAAVVVLIAGTTASAQISFEGSADYGRMNDLTYDLVTEGKVYGLTLGNHIVVSEDGGANWAVLYSYPENGTSIRGLRNLGNDRLSFYVQNSGANANNTIYIYDLGTDTVTAVTAPFEAADRTWVNSYDVLASDSNVIMFDMGYRIGASTFSKVHYTTDGGANWTQIYYHVDNNEIFVNNVAINPSNGQELYIALGIGPNAEEGGLLYSTDGGATWTEKVTGQSLKPIAFDPADSDHIWIGTATGFNTTVQNVYESTDGGENWTIAPITWDDWFLEEINYIAVDPMDSNHVVVLEANEMAITTDGGATWTNVIYGDDPSSYYYGLKAAYNPFQAGEMLINGDYHPLTSTDGGMTVQRLLNPFFLATASAVVQQGEGHQYYSVQRGIVHKNLTTGVENSYFVEPINFVFSDPAPTYIADPLTEGRLYIFVPTFSGQFTIVSNDHGATFSMLYSTFGDNMLHAVTDPGNPTGAIVSYEFDGTKYIEFSNPNSPVVSPLTMPSSNGHWATYIEPGNTGLLLAGIGGEMFKTTDGTGTWTNVSTGLNLDAAFDRIFEIVRNPNNPNEYVIATTGGIYKSVDGGDNWTQVYSGSNVRKIAYSDANDVVLMAGTYSGPGTQAQLILSTTNGDSWEALPLETIANAGSTAMDFTFADHQVDAYVATYDMGLIKVSVETGELSVNNPLPVAQKMALYPNPTADVLNIQLPGQTGVSKVNVYNMLGALVMSEKSDRLSVAQLNTGLYLIEVVDQQGNVHVSRFIRE